MMLSAALPNLRRQTSAFFAIAALAFGVHAETLSVTHAQGTTQVPLNPQKAVVFDMATLDTLRTLGIDGIAGIPDSKFPQHLAPFNDQRYIRTGSLFEPDYEVINRLAPDLIIVGGRSGAKQPDLAKLAPTIDLTVDQKDLVASLDQNTRTLGKIFNREDNAETELKKLHAAIAALNQKAASAGKALIILTTGGKMSAYGPGSRFGTIHDAFGFAAAVPDLNVSNHGQAISFEFILKSNPDWLFVIDRDAAIGSEGQAAAQLLDNALVRNTKAWKNQQVVYLNALNWYLLGSAGLTAMQENVQQLSDAIDAHR